MFNFDSKNEFRANLNGEKSKAGYLVFENDGIHFHEDFSISAPLETFLPAGEIEVIDFQDTSNQIFQPSLARVFFLRIFAFARPRNWSDNSCRVEIEMANGDFVFFDIEGITAAEIRARINAVVEKYFI